MDNISWDEYFMYIAEISALRSKDPKTKVGACIVNPETHHILSIGYNGFPAGFPETEELWNSDEKHKYVVHAEANAILNSTTSLDGSVAYITMFPCNECAKLLAQKGIKRVVYLQDKFRDRETGQVAIEIFDKLGITVEQFSGRMFPPMGGFNGREIH